MLGLLVNVTAHAQHDLFGHGLDAGGQVHVPLLELRLPAAAAGRRTGRWKRRLVMVRPWQ